MRNYPKGMQPFVSIALRSDNALDAYHAAKGIKGVSKQDAKWFGDTFGRGESGERVDMKRAFELFYDEVQKGQYVMEGELERIKEIIKEELLKEQVEDYIKAYRSFDSTYMMSDDPRAYSSGRAQEQKIKDIYNNLSDVEKRQAAIWYRDYFVENDMWSGSDMNRSVTRWRPEQDFDPDSFDGIHYRG
jgi:predicted RNA-binding protein